MKPGTEPKIFWDAKVGPLEDGLFWPRHPSVELGEWKGKAFLASPNPAEHRIARERDLPVEFFGHQLMGADLESDEGICGFVRKWGLVRNPFVEDDFEHVLARTRDEETWFWLKAWEQECIESKKLTREIFQGLREEWLEELSEQGAFHLSRHDANSIVSVAEARSTLELLRKCMEYMFEEISTDGKAWVEGQDGFPCLPEPLASHSEVWRYFVDAGSTGLVRLVEYSNHYAFVRAICNQVISAWASGDRWKECAREGCEVIYMHKQGQSVSTRKSRNDAGYCCHWCQNNRKSKRPFPGQ